MNASDLIIGVNAAADISQADTAASSMLGKEKWLALSEEQKVIQLMSQWYKIQSLPIGVPNFCWVDEDGSTRYDVALGDMPEAAYQTLPASIKSCLIRISVSAAIEATQLDDTGAVISGPVAIEVTDDSGCLTPAYMQANGISEFQAGQLRVKMKDDATVTSTTDYPFSDRQLSCLSRFLVTEVSYSTCRVS